MAVTQVTLKRTERNPCENMVKMPGRKWRGTRVTTVFLRLLQKRNMKVNKEIDWDKAFSRELEYFCGVFSEDTDRQELTGMVED